MAVQSPLEVKRTFKPYGPKTDAVDSLQIAEYACRHFDKLSFWQPRNEILEQVKALLATREQFVSQNVAHKNALQAIQRKAVRTPFAEQAHTQMIEQFKKQIQAIDHEIRRLIESDPTFKEMLLLLLSVPGVGLLLAAHMILLTQISLGPQRVGFLFWGLLPTNIPAALLFSNTRLLDISDLPLSANFSISLPVPFARIRHSLLPTLLAKQ